MMGGNELKRYLNSDWKLDFREHKGLEVQIPSSVYSVLLENKLMKDPFYRDNEYEVRDLCYEDCEFYTEVNITKEEFEREKIILRFNGVDTIAYLYVNDIFVGFMNNMHRSFEFNIKEVIKLGSNSIKLIIKSPIKYIQEANQKYELWGVDTTMEGYPHIRKAHCMFGWDWGPQLPDMGIWRDVELFMYDTARIEDVYIRQSHKDGEVTLNITTELDVVYEEELKNLTLDIIIESPENKVILSSYSIDNENLTKEIKIENPMLWWPNGYGKQNLYSVKVAVKHENIVIDLKELKIGLRTLTLSNKKDKWGKEFSFVINGEKIFSMGANYIPEDNILARTSKEKTKTLIEDCISANFNTIRVWGGGIYPDDYFFELCDEYGLIVWQDFMFACSTYALTKDFEANITAEFINVIKRIRNHPSLGLLCGNNEIESAILYWGLPNNERIKADYITLFERILPEVCKEYIPEVYYWPSSPSSGGGYDEPSSYDKGDTHYWDVWHGNKPFEDYKNFYFRFCSEFGFEAFPSIKTLNTCCEKEDLNPFSYVMESHQKCKGGNTKLLTYMADNYLYPKDMEGIIYISQLLQGDAIKYGVEHWRRFRGRCMGAIYWQLNDCWPGPSWASRDYYGRWKAMHYMARRFFAPVLLSAHKDEFSIVLNVSNETFNKFNGIIKYKIVSNSSEVIFEGKVEAAVGGLSSKDIITLEVQKYIEGFERERVFIFSLEDDEGNIISEDSLLFTKPKHFKFLNPNIKVDVIEEKDKFALEITAENYAKGVCIDFEGFDCILSDNYFDMSDKKKVTIRKIEEEITEEIIHKNISICSLYNI
jgi:Beta-galactosidase/beta-glucuronidase